MAYRAQLVIRTSEPEGVELINEIRELAQSSSRTIADVAIDYLRDGQPKATKSSQKKKKGKAKKEDPNDLFEAELKAKLEAALPEALERRLEQELQKILPDALEAKLAEDIKTQLPQKLKEAVDAQLPAALEEAMASKKKSKSKPKDEEKSVEALEAAYTKKMKAVDAQIETVTAKLEEANEEVKLIHQENKALKEENAELKKSIELLESESVFESSDQFSFALPEEIYQHTQRHKGIPPKSPPSEGKQIATHRDRSRLIKIELQNQMAEQQGEVISDIVETYESEGPEPAAHKIADLFKDLNAYEGAILRKLLKERLTIADADTIFEVTTRLDNYRIYQDRLLTRESD